MFTLCTEKEVSFRIRKRRAPCVSYTMCPRIIPIIFLMFCDHLISDCLREVNVLEQSCLVDIFNYPSFYLKK